ncbi:hypothetical protein IWW37_005032 [Coemansia sp. RSA 2050]|nr:hypothetical protein IWW37_005032 [Coemansia sp. RSA 2050]KAJ2731139.1 hypothetical protein IW152_004763 [Coemansia sp. BCRC 34962]
MATLGARHFADSSSLLGTTTVGESVPAYSASMLLQLCTLEAKLAESRETTRRARISTEESLQRARRVQRLRQQIGTTAERIEELRRRLGQQARRVEAASNAVEALAERKAVVQERVCEAERALQRVPEQISGAVVKLRQDRIILEDLRAMLARQRAAVARQLLFIFPIDIGDTSKNEECGGGGGAIVQGEDAYGGWSICGLRVIGPDGVRRWQESEEAAAALGLVTRVVDAVSRLMCTPLRFPVVPRGSRSTVCNPVAKAVVPTTQSAAAVAEWPLYMLRVSDRPRLHMAVRLLSVCIEQCLCQHGIVDVDRHQLLPNLVQLLLAIEGCSFAS